MKLIKKDSVINVLKQCFDPELPVDLWNLGLIYDIQIQEAYNEQQSDINIVMSLTTPGCTMGEQIAQDIKNKLESNNKVNQVFVEVTFDPPWEPGMMSEEAREKLGVGLNNAQETKETKIFETQIYQKWYSCFFNYDCPKKCTWR